MGRGQFYAVLMAVGVVLVAGGFWRYANWPRVAVYGVFRQAVQRDIAWQTASWEHVQGRYVELVFQQPDRGVARTVLQVADESYTQVAKMMGYRPPTPVRVVIYPDRASMGESFGGAADESAMGIYWGGVIRILSPREWMGAVSPAKMEHVFHQDGPLVHEMAHLIVDYRARGNYPRWLTEGIAQYVEREITGFVLDGPRANARAWYPLESMDRQFDALPDQSLAYRQSLELIDLLVQKHGLTVIDRLLTSLGKGATINQAFRRVTGMDTQGLMQGLRKSLTGRCPGGKMYVSRVT